MDLHLTKKSLIAVGWHSLGAIYVMSLYDMLELNRRDFKKGISAWTVLEVFESMEAAVVFKSECIRIRRELRKNGVVVGPETIADAIVGGMRAEGGGMKHET